MPVFISSVGAQKISTDLASFRIVEIPNVGTLSLPEYMEPLSPLMKTMVEGVSKGIGAPEVEEINFQTKAMNEWRGTPSDIATVGVTTSPNTLVGLIGTSTDFSFTKAQMAILEPLLMEQSKEVINVMNSLGSRAKMKSWLGVSSARINKRESLRYAFVVETQYSELMYEFYIFPVGEKLHTLRFSYNIGYSQKWAPIFLKIRDSFLIQNNSGPRPKTSERVADSKSARPVGDEYKIVNIEEVGTLELPPTMELQSGTVRKATGNLVEAVVGEPSNLSSVTFQATGVNQLIIDPTNVATFTINTEVREPGSLPQFHKPSTLPSGDLSSFERFLRQQTDQVFGMMTKQGVSAKVTRWNGLAKESINGQMAFVYRYVVLMMGHEVNYEVLLFYNYDRIHTISAAHSSKTSTKWKPILDRMRDSFRITNIRGPVSR